MPRSLASTALCGLAYLVTPMPAQFAALQPQPQGTICGTVQNEKGGPAAFVVVMAFDLGPHSGMEDTSKTDAVGHYCVEHVRPGHYAMSADDPGMGYPLLASSFYMPHIPEPQIVVSGASPHPMADWSIPYKAGFLTVHATDRATGKALPSIGFYLAIRGSEEFRYMRGSWAGGTVMLPPNEDIYVRVKVQGYATWPVGEQKGRLVTVQPGASIDLSAVMDATTEPQPEF